MAQFTNDQRDSVAARPVDVEGRGWLIGALVPVGAGEIRVAYSQYRVEADAAGVSDEGRARKIALGYVHNLSKRTALYATVAHTRGRGAITAAGTTLESFSERGTGYDLGIRHAF
jgi:predicted porin